MKQCLLVMLVPVVDVSVGNVVRPEFVRGDIVGSSDFDISTVP